MFKKKGILLKTFAFTSLLIGIVVIISFGILYFALPDYYLYTKNKNLQERADELVAEINKAETENELAQLISDFSLSNNSNIMSFNKKDEFVPNLSSPFVSMNAISTTDKGVTVSVIKPFEKDFSKDNLKIHTVINREATKEDTDTIIVKPVTNNYRFKLKGVTDISHVAITRKVENAVIRSITILSTLQPIDEAKGVMLSLIPYLLLIDILIALAAAYFYSKQLTRPIIRLSQTAAKMQSLESNISCNIRTHDELGNLSQNIDSLYSNLRANIENLKYEMDKVSILEKSKTDFMRAASHELKTPIAALNGIVEGMIDNVGKYKDKETYLQESKKLIDHLTKLVNEILKASKLDTTEHILNIEEVELSEIIERLLENNKIFIEEKKLNVSFEKKKLEVYVDKIFMENTLSNIISNAVKYTGTSGQIHIAFSETKEQKILSIENQCEPIPTNDLQKLFEPFYTSNFSRNRNKSKSGTGLGLYIVKKNLEALQLSYKLENTNLGLKFNIYFVKDPQ